MIKKTSRHSPLVLIIFDGWGVAASSKGNAITLARTPVFDHAWKYYPRTCLESAGKAVGLPLRQVGNSEAGHLNLGAGRIVDQDIVLISKSIADGTFFKNTALREVIQHVRQKRSRLHLMGILSNGQSPHMSPEHLDALLLLARRHRTPNVTLHFFTDGRDAPPYAAIRLVKRLEKKLWSHEVIGTIMGRLYLDRAKNWETTEKAYHTLVLGGWRKAKSPQEAISQAYNRGETDEFIAPTIVEKDGKIAHPIGDHDGVVFFNLRSDRARQLTKPFVQRSLDAKNPSAFRRRKVLHDLRFVAMTDFGPDLEDVLTAYPSRDLEGTLPMILHADRQLYLAEAQKYSHITYFFNGGYADPVGGEDRIAVPSFPLKHFDEKPAMSAGIITQTVVRQLKSRRYRFIAVNFANADMLGHTGNLKAAIAGIEYLDRCLGKIIREVLRKQGSVIVTGDHGNVEKMIDLKTGEIDTQHSDSPVPFLFVTKERRWLRRKKLPSGILANVAPTILDFFELERPDVMTEKSLFER